MKNRPDVEAQRICPAVESLPIDPASSMAPPIYPASVYRCKDVDEARDLLTGAKAGYIYRRNGHPNADHLSHKCRQLHGAEEAVVCSSGMSALSLALLALVEANDHLVVSNQLYGQSFDLFSRETARLGIEHTTVDTCDLTATAAAFRPNSKLVIVETLTNPLLRVSDIAALADVAHQHDALLLVDNTFASPALCRPLDWGADLVVESLTKIMNGHSDVMLGLLAGRTAVWSRVEPTLSAWGFCASPFECWLAARGLGTMALRVERASDNAAAAAKFLADRDEVAEVHYPGLTSHADHHLATRQLAGRFGSIVSFTLAGGLAAAERFLSATAIPFSPSLGDLCTTLSHPASTSHLRLAAERRAALGITDGTIRLSVGIEPADWIQTEVEKGLRG